MPSSSKIMLKFSSKASSDPKHILDQKFRVHDK
jgi:hypothetical protein